jgi:integrase
MAGVRKLRSGTWQGWFKDYEGHRAFFTLSHTATRREVRDAAHALEVEHAQIREGVRPRPDQQSAMRVRPIGEIVEEYLAWGAFQGSRGGRPWSPRHRQTRAMQLTWWIDRLRLRTLGECQGLLPAMERVLQAMKQAGAAPQTLKHRQAALCAFTRWCTHRGYLETDPLAHRTPVQVQVQRRRRALTLAETHQLLAHGRPTHRLLYETALVTGLRANELRQLTLDHLDIEQGALRLDAQWTKNRQPGLQPIPSILMVQLYEAGRSGAPLDAYRRYRRTKPTPAQPLLFVPHDTASMLAIDLRRADIPLETSQGMVDFHSLRVTAINLLMSQGASAVETQAFARHQSLQMTLGIYGRAQANRMSALVETLAEALQVQPVCAPAVHAQAVGKTSSTPVLVMTRDPERPTILPTRRFLPGLV